MSDSSPGPVAIFGGTFDPVHYGHLRAAWEAKEALGIEDFRFIPAGNPPHRGTGVSDASHRLAMLERALPEGCGFRIDARELRRPGPSFMVDTLAELREEAGEAPLLLLIGQDSANSLDSWQRWEELFTLAHLVVMSRAGDIQRYSGTLDEAMRPRHVNDVSALRSAPCGLVARIQVTSLAISSSRIRALLAQGRSPRYLLPGPVLGYIEQAGIYGASAP